MSQVNDLISVGEVINTHGHKGEVRVWPLTDFPERFKKDTVYTYEKNNINRDLTIETSRPHKNFYVIKFREIADMNAAEDLKGGFLKISRDDLMELSADSFYIFEIIGMEVVTDDGIILGAIKDVLQTGSNDLYVVQGEKKEYLIPALKEVVIDIDREKRKMIIKPMEGLLDL